MRNPKPGRLIVVAFCLLIQANLVDHGVTTLRALSGSDQVAAFLYFVLLGGTTLIEVGYLIFALLSFDKETR